MQMKKIDEMFQQYTGNPIDMCYKIVEEMESEGPDQQAESLLSFCEIFGTRTPTGE